MTESLFAHFTADDWYEILDIELTEILDKSGAEITSEVDEVLVRFNRTLREALGLANPTHPGVVAQ
ncbi:hypothetical protein [Aquisediminimonas profunda]|uniref:hypothetical protein n=1 Tax=Aquisediminimonas profunda TaxID=1550733 RepID=UPI001C6389A1|nr:hypothetical protein [Aquisediminimonas profunda]